MVARGVPRPSGWTGAAFGLAMGALVGFLLKELDLTALVSYTSDRSPLVLVTALAGAVLGASRLRGVLVAAAAALSLLWLVVAFTPLCHWLARDLPRRDALEPADAVFVLGSSLQLDGDLNVSSMSRLLHGLELLGRGLAPRLVLTELDMAGPTYRDSAEKLMKNLGLGHPVVSVGPVGNTRDEAVLVGQLYRKKGWKKLLVVTSPAHSRRASAALEKEGVAVISSPSTQADYDMEGLGRPDERIRAFGSLIHERVGYWYYRWRDWI